MLLIEVSLAPSGNEELSAVDLLWPGLVPPIRILPPDQQRRFGQLEDQLTPLPKKESLMISSCRSQNP